MKEFFAELKEIFRDPDNRTVLKVFKWLTVLFELGAIGGIAGVILAAITIACWELPKKN